MSSFFGSKSAGFGSIQSFLFLMLLVWGLASCANTDSSDSTPSASTIPAPLDLSTLQTSESSACGQLLKGKDQCRTINFPAGSQIQRSYWVHRPETLTANPPLLIMLHGVTTSAEIEEFILQSRKLADDRKYLAVLVNGYDLNGKGYGFWNTSPHCLTSVSGDATTNTTTEKVCAKLQQIDDLGLLETIINNMVASYGADPKRVYLLGHSNGGIMSHYMACQHAEKIAAVVSFAGPMRAEIEECKPTTPVAVMHIHGTGDTVVPYAGGRAREGLLADFLNKLISNAVTLAPEVLSAYIAQILPNFPQGASAEATIARWSQINGCANLPPSEQSPFILTLADDFTQAATTQIARYAILQSFQQCQRPLAFVKIEGGTHVPLFDFPLFHKTVGNFFDEAPSR